MKFKVRDQEPKQVDKEVEAWVDVDDDGNLRLFLGAGTDQQCVLYLEKETAMIHRAAIAKSSAERLGIRLLIDCHGHGRLDYKSY